MDRKNYPDSITERTSEKQPPFKLCFSKDRLLGRSDLRALKTEDDPTASKFYSTKYESYENEDKNEKAKDQQGNIYKFINRRSPLTSHAYGWWYEQGIRPTESRIDFRKKTSDLVNYQMKIYAEDQKLKNSKH
nr:uncharacterized protein LOC117607328 [Osmia lignaria]